MTVNTFDPNAADSCAIDHAFTDIAQEQRQVAGAAACHDAHLACFRCVRRNGHNGVLRDLVRDECPCGNGGCALDDRDCELGRGGASDEPCLAAVGALAGVENPFALTLDRKSVV